MSHKNYDSYSFVLTNLQTLCSEKGNEIELNPKFVMCDFENALRKGIRKYFPDATIAGCYFHYSKALWLFMARNSMTTKERLA